MSEQNTATDEMLVLAEAVGDVKARTEKLESEFSTQTKPLDAALATLNGALAALKTLQFHVLDTNIATLSTRLEGQRTALDEQINVIVAELKKADEANATQTGEAATALRAELQAIRAEFTRVELEARENLTKFASVPGPQGEPGRGIKAVGPYSARKYGANELVSYMGGSYLSNEDNNDERPGAKAKKWTQIAARPSTLGGGVSAPSTIPLPVNLGGTNSTTARSAFATIAQGTNTNDSASAGYVGEYVSNSVAQASPVNITTSGTPIEVTSISLTAGDWDVTGVVFFSHAVGAVGTYYATVVHSAVSLTALATNLDGNHNSASVNASIIAAETRFSLAATTTVYLVVQSGFSGGTIGAYGTVRARRVR